jgi:hypothetical protein
MQIYLLVLCLSVNALSNICLAAPPPPSTSKQLPLQQPNAAEINPATPLLKIEISHGDDDGIAKTTTTTADVDPELIASNIPEKEPSHCGGTAGNQNDVNNEPSSALAFGDGEMLLLGRQIVGFMPMYVLLPTSNNRPPTAVVSDEEAKSSIAPQQQQRSRINTWPSGNSRSPPLVPSSVQKNEDDDAASMPPPSSSGRPSYGPSSPMRPKQNKEDRRRINIITNAPPDLLNRLKNKDRTAPTTSTVDEPQITPPTTTTAATDRKAKEQQGTDTSLPSPSIAADGNNESLEALDLPRALPIQRSKRQFGYRPNPYYYYDPYYSGYHPDYYSDYDDYDTDITIYV